MPQREIKKRGEKERKEKRKENGTKRR